jgi:methyltransferase (TIGR00027 family)
VDPVHRAAVEQDEGQERTGGILQDGRPAYVAEWTDPEHGIYDRPKDARKTMRASTSSQVVTAMRALAHAGVTEVRDFSDPTALAMLPPSWRLPTQLLASRLKARPGIARRMFESTDGRADLIAFRTSVLDAAWHDAHAAGARQLVVLGAGLDGRAFRLHDVGDSTVFEVDQPATQALKRRRAAAMSPLAARHAYVPVDFERDSLERALGAAGHRTDEQTFWIWEGVTQYLSADAQQATLDAVGRLSAPGSRIALTYIVAGTRPPAALLRLVGEPWIGMLSTNDLRERLSRAGLALASDTGQREWRARHGAGPPRSGEVGERIAIGERSP